ncbi:riboflavin synthase [Neptunomonas antarctica]|uniref:Riboflavin synthase n=1 Tax=Neptunomonas antarctica TaxID=619304 RepID=A0A1N7J3N4_9GAMM|nr:riboflavin synthase [Neptunomonas antarctica]SIS43968.1 riboflavin synthase alpha chain [Neptunomonas antarctica]
MFTGIIEAIGNVAAIEQAQGDMRLYIRTNTLDLSDVKRGDSIATNGVCLTAVELTGDGFWADVSRESLAHTRFASLKVGEKVNLEKALMASGRLGGHIVTGHVDGIGKVIERREDARSIHLVVEAPAALSRYIAAKGSITVDGVSLTVNSVEGALLTLNIVPHTAQETLLDRYVAGTEVHLEVDIIARYMERLLLAGRADDTQEQQSGLTLATLAEHGYMKR